MTCMGTPVGNENPFDDPRGPNDAPDAAAIPETPPDARAQARRLHARITAAVLTERQAIREVAICLAEMARTQGYRELGYAGLAEYGERSFSFGSGKAGQLARLGSRLARLPALDKALASGALGWTKARTVSQVATPETEEAWIAVALAQTSRELEQLVFDSRLGQPPRDSRDEVDPPRYAYARFRMELDHLELLMKALTSIRHHLGDVDLSASQLLLELAERELARLDDEASHPSANAAPVEHQDTATASDSATPTATATDSDMDSAPGRDPASETVPTASAPAEHVFRPHPPRGENAYRLNYRIIAHRCPDCEKVWADTRGGRFELSRESRERVECDCEEIAGDESAGTPGHLTRSIPPATRRAVLVRDGGHCQVPGCRNYRHLDLHHILPRSRGGRHTPTNLVTVCSTHHELLHRDIVQATREDDGTLTWSRGEGEPLGIILAIDNDRAEIDHEYLTEFDGPPGTWYMVDEPAPNAELEHVFEDPAPQGPTRFPRGRTSFVLGDESRMATRDVYLPLPTGLG